MKVQLIEETKPCPKCGDKRGLSFITYNGKSLWTKCQNRDCELNLSPPIKVRVLLIFLEDNDTK